MKGQAIRRQVLLAALLSSILLWVGAAAAAQTATPTPTATVTVAVTPTLTPAAVVGVSPAVTATIFVTPTGEITPTVAITLSDLITPTALVTPEPFPAPEPVVGEVTLQGPASRVEATIYNQGLGLVRQTLPVTLEAGLSRVRLMDVPTAILPTSVRVTVPASPTAIAVVEQGYLYDLISAQALLERYIGQTVSLRTVTGERYTGTLLAARDQIILADGAQVRILRSDQVAEYELAALPDGLMTRPALEWLLRAPEAGTWELEVSYLTSGLSWSADYAALLNADDTQLDLDGWVTLDNQSGSSLSEARVKLVAGEIHRVGASGPRMEAKAVEAASSVSQSALLGYQLFDIRRPVTLRDNQTRQMAFASAPGVQVEKVLIFQGAPDVLVSAGDAILDGTYGAYARRAAQIWLEFLNEEASGLGLPLPAGTVRIYRADVDGAVQFVGEDQIGHTPVGEALRLYVGDATQVVGERVQTSYRQLAEREAEESYQITLRNRGPQGVSVRVVERLFRAQDARIIASSEDYAQIDAQTIHYAVAVQPDAPTVITYTVRYRW